MIETKLNITEQFWIIAYCRQYDECETTLFQFNSAYDMNEFIADMSVSASESMGTEVFNIIAMSHEWKLFNQLVENEKNEIAELQAMADKEFELSEEGENNE